MVLLLILFDVVMATIFFLSFFLFLVSIKLYTNFTTYYNAAFKIFKCTYSRHGATYIFMYSKAQRTMYLFLNIFFSPPFYILDFTRGTYYCYYSFMYRWRWWSGSKERNFCIIFNIGVLVFRFFEGIFLIVSVFFWNWDDHKRDWNNIFLKKGRKWPRFGSSIAKFRV